MDINQVICSDNLEYLKTLPDNCIDSCVTDPPYGLGKQPDIVDMMKSWIEGKDYKMNGGGFMGKEWDSFVPNPSLWKEVYRVLKPGAYLLSFFGTRTYDLGVMAIRFAGFEIRDSILYCFGSGFPKNHNIALGIDKELGYGNRGYRIAVANRKHPDGTIEPNGEQLPDYESKTDGSKQWDGWGNNLKPAVEPIVLARKPLSEKNIAQNVLKWGTGGLNIEKTRIETDENTQRNITNNSSSMFNLDGENITGGHTKGRFPANLILDDSEEVEECFPYTKGSSNVECNFEQSNQNNIIKITNNIKSGGHFNDEGSASRYFKRIAYYSKCSSWERNAGLDGFKKEVHRYGKGIGGSEISKNKSCIEQNHHPTLKPIKLMEYLITLVTPPNGIVLDPFGGSGSTGCAAAKLGIDYLLIELDPEYCDIARARIKFWDDNRHLTVEQMKKKTKKTGTLHDLPEEQMELFDEKNNNKKS